MTTPAGEMSVRRLGQAPHRLLFFIGGTNLLLAMAWWAAWLLAQRIPALAMPAPATPMVGGWVHAFVMQYQVLPSFMAGFLLTVFPRWMALPEVPLWRYAPVGIGLFGGQIATLAGAMGWPSGFMVGLFMTLAGWIALLATLGPLVWRDRSSNWHARSIYLALVLGLCGLLAHAAYSFGASPLWELASIKIGTFGLLLPVYLTVAHRMFPFFASGVVSGYIPWRPYHLLVSAWLLIALHLGLELFHVYRWLWAPDLGLLALSLTMCWRWWPRAPMPGLLRVLFLGLAWLPVAFSLYASQSVIYLFTGAFPLGRAPAHALFIGFFGSVLVAMVTRVTRGHSGRPLLMPPVAWFAFVAIQVVTVIRVGAEFSRDPLPWHALAAVGWVVALAPWALSCARTYLAARVDGKPG